MKTELLFSNNPCAAFLVEIVRAFEKYHSSHYLGRTAVQKLTYFCQATGVPIPCSFEIYNYGPYSDTIAFAVGSMLADDILEDRSSNPKYSNYRLLASSPNFDSNFTKKAEKHRLEIERVVETLGGFQPEQLELIGTLHFIAAKHKSLRGKASKTEVLKEFVAIKRSKFPEDEVKSWYDALISAHLV